MLTYDRGSCSDLYILFLATCIQVTEIITRQNMDECLTTFTHPEHAIFNSSKTSRQALFFWTLYNELKRNLVTYTWKLYYRGNCNLKWIISLKNHVMILCIDSLYPVQDENNDVADGTVTARDQRIVRPGNFSPRWSVEQSETESCVP